MVKKFLKEPNKIPISKDDGDLLTSLRLTGRRAGKQPPLNPCPPFATAWSFAICGFHLVGVQQVCLLL